MPRDGALIERHAADAKLPDWKSEITAECPKRADLCGVHFPDLLNLYGQLTCRHRGTQ